MTYTIENTASENRTVAMHDAARPFAVIASRSWNKVVGRYTTKAQALRRIRDLSK